MDPNVTNLQNIANQSQQSANQLATQAPTLADSFKNAVMTKYGQDNPLIQAQSGALKNYIAGMGGEMEKYLPQNTGGIALSPTHIEALMAQDRANLLAPLSATNELVSMGYGGLQNLMNSANASYQSQVDAAQKAAELARQQYQDAYTQWAKQQELDLQRQQMNLQYGNNSGLNFSGNNGGNNGTPAGPQVPDNVAAQNLWNTIKQKHGNDYNSSWAEINTLAQKNSVPPGVVALLWAHQKQDADWVKSQPNTNFQNIMGGVGNVGGSILSHTGIPSAIGDIGGFINWLGQPSKK